MLLAIIYDCKDDIPSIRALTEREMKLSEEAGYSYVDRLAQLEEELHAKGQYAKETSPFRRMAKFRKPSENAQELSRKATRMLEATRYLKNEYIFQVITNKSIELANLHSKLTEWD